MPRILGGKITDDRQLMLSSRVLIFCFTKKIGAVCLVTGNNASRLISRRVVDKTSKQTEGKEEFPFDRKKKTEGKEKQNHVFTDIG